MKSTKTLSYLSIPVMALTLSACGGDDSDGNNNDADAPARLSVGVTDAPVDDASNVYVEFSGVTLIRAGRDGDQENDDDVVIRFTENHRIDLLAYQQGESYDLIDDEEIPAGEYAQMRLMVETDKLNDTVIIFNDGSSHELSVPSGDQTGLKLVSGFTATAGGELSLMLDFDLRKGIVETGNGDYKLKPTIRVIDTAEYGEIEGTVAQGLCAADDSMAIYVYQGEVSEPEDLGADAEPLATGSVATDLTYEISYLTPGSYTVALTCQADLDDPENDDIEFGSGQGFADVSGPLTVTDDADTEYNFR